MTPWKPNLRPSDWSSIDLLQQPLVRRMPNLQAAFKRHPNCPGHAK